jgi:hypothetical protein
VSTEAPSPSRDLLLKVKAHFVGKGTTLAAWCRSNKIDQSNARQALLGSWDGPNGQAVRIALAKEAGLMPTTKPATKRGKAAA